MAEQEDIIFNTKINTGASVTSVKSLKAELRAVTNELGSLDEGSAAFIKAAQRAGELKDKIGDIKDTVAAFNPEAKFKAFAGVIGGVANGFAVAQGAMALFGTENKDIEKAILKTQGAIAIATGLNGLLGMKDAFNILAMVIKTNVVAAFATMRAAIISTGILGLVALIGGLVYAWIEEADANKKATEELERFNKESQKIKEAADNYARVALKDLRAEEYRINKEADDKLEELNDRKAKGEVTALEARVENTLIETQRAVELEKAQEAEAKRIESVNKTAAEKQKVLNEKKKAELKKAHDYELALKKSLTLAGQEQTADLKRQDDEQEKDRKLRNASLLLSKQEEIQYNRDTAAANKQIAEQEKAAKLDQLIAISSAFDSFAQLAGQQTEAGKALAIASTLISTWAAAQKAYESQFLLINPASPIMATLAAAGAVASGLARVAAIVAVKVPGGAGGSAPSIPSGGNAPAPIIRPPSSMVHINDNAGPIKTKSGSQNMKVYVTETDITRSQKRVSSIEQKATIK